MLEREMEDLIAAHPDHFFPHHGFVLQGRQQSFRGVGRFDLLFVDRHGMSILMELKAVPAHYEVIDQIARYRDALVSLGSSNIIMWIVAPSIPPGMKDFLSHLGIEYTEIHQSAFIRAAALMEYVLRDMPSAKQAKPQGTDKGSAPDALSNPGTPTRTHMQPGKMQQAGNDEWGFGIGTQPSFLIRALERGGTAKENLRSEYISHFHPELSYAEAKGKSGFNVFFSDSKRPLGTYHASRSLLILTDAAGKLSLDHERAVVVKAAIGGGALDKLRGLHFQQDKIRFDEILRSFGLPTEP